MMGGDTLRCLQKLKGSRNGVAGALAAVLQPCAVGFGVGHPAEPLRGAVAPGRGWFDVGALWHLSSETFPSGCTWSFGRW